MRLPSRTTLCVALLLSATVRVGAFAQSTVAAPDDKSLDEVLVTGERPGPGMWRISKDGHDVWILATLTPLPKNMTWRSVAVEQRIADSQQVLSAPDVDVDIGFFRGISLIPALLGARKSPDGRTLEQILPHDVYIRWLALRVKFLGSYDEHKRPMLAAVDLYDAVIDQSGLNSNGMIWNLIEKTAHKDHVPVQDVLLKIKLDDAKGTVHDLGKIPQDAEVACFTKTIERLEVDLPSMRQRANFWSLGDIKGLQSLPYPDDDAACLNAFMAVPQLRDQFERTRSQMDDLWVSTVGTALEKNASTFAVLPIGKLLKQDGALDRLRRLGYEIQEPQ